MGKIKQGILGGFKGKVGTVIGSSWNGIAYMKGLPQSQKDPKTAAQLMQRNFFKELQHLVSQLTDEQLVFLFPSVPRGKNRHNLLIQQLAENPIISNGEKHVDLAALSTIGNAPTLELPVVTVEPDGDNLSIFWFEESDIRTRHADEYPTFFVANLTQKRIFLVNSNAPLEETATGVMTLNLATYGDAGDYFSGFMLLTGSKAPLIGFSGHSVTERPVKSNL